MKWTKRLSRYTLPGMGLNWDASYFGLLFLAMLLVALYTFLRDYQAALRELYIFRYGTQILRQGAVMPTLNTLLRHKLAVFSGPMRASVRCVRSPITVRFSRRQRAFIS